jgi:hypothetical protein
MRREQQTRTDRPGFCSLLKLGEFLSIMGVAGGILLAAYGLVAAESNPVLAATLVPVGIPLALQSLVSLGLIQALLWIVDSLLDLKSPPPKPAEEEMQSDDGIPQKPVLKRRRVQ